MRREFINGHTVGQRIDNEMLCLTDLQSAYNALRETDKTLPEKQLSKYFENSYEQRMLASLLAESGYITQKEISAFYGNMAKIGAIKVLKSLGAYSTKGRGANRKVYTDPYIFVAVSMWINPEFKAKVIKWVGDQLIVGRIEAGKNFIRLTDSIQLKIVPTLTGKEKNTIYSRCAMLLNKKVFGVHDKNLRQLASREELAKLRDLEIEVSTLVNVGHLKSYSDIDNYLSNKGNI